MSKLQTATLTIDLDEPAFRLSEVNLMSPDFHGWRRYQVIWVVRGDRFAEYREDLGPRERWEADQFSIPGGVQYPNGRLLIVESVGSLRDLADWLRGRDKFSPDPIPFAEQLEQAIHNTTARSVFGPHFKKERHDH